MSDFTGGHEFLDKGHIVAGNTKCFKAVLTAIQPHLWPSLKRQRDDQPKMKKSARGRFFHFHFCRFDYGCSASTNWPSRTGICAPGSRSMRTRPC